MPYCVCIYLKKETKTTTTTTPKKPSFLSFVFLFKFANTCYNRTPKNIYIQYAVYLALMMGRKPFAILFPFRASNFYEVSSKGF